eukprot:scaffold32239_cov116-Skeletonema_marinoi.AAC.1
MEVWATESVWNFENKLFLLQAERHYAFGEMDRAAEKYKLAQKSSKKHRFIHEEALACELAASFHVKAGNVKFVAELIDRAVNCYQTWGAEGKNLLTITISSRHFFPDSVASDDVLLCSCGGMGICFNVDLFILHYNRVTLCPMPFVHTSSFFE